ncbi:MAG: hypothetical protein ABFD53_12920, partial [Anaerolineaceae bacterium]
VVFEGKAYEIVSDNSVSDPIEIPPAFTPATTPDNSQVAYPGAETPLPPVQNTQPTEAARNFPCGAGFLPLAVIGAMMLCVVINRWISTKLM